MREYRFRGKRKDNGEWVEGFLFVSQMSGCFILLSKIDIKKHRDGGRTMGDKLEQYEVDPATVGQYTGLKDMNDVEIYEGDILGNEEGIMGVVYYGDKPNQLLTGQYYLGDSKGMSNDWTYEDDAKPEGWHWQEVVGNRWANPKLLESGVEA